MSESRTVQCTFYDPADRCLRTAPIEAKNGLGPLVVGIRTECAKHCKAHKLSGWAQPDPSGEWICFEMHQNFGRYQRMFPTQEAAEMWLIHHFA